MALYINKKGHLEGRPGPSEKEGAVPVTAEKVKTRKITFHAPEKAKGKPFTGGVYFEDGETKEIPQDVASRLFQEFPGRFSWADLKPESEKLAKPSVDRAMKGSKDK
jgi:hypothetical protein